MKILKAFMLIPFLSIPLTFAPTPPPRIFDPGIGTITCSGFTLTGATALSRYGTGPFAVKAVETVGPHHLFLHLHPDGLLFFDKAGSVAPGVGPQPVTLSIAWNADPGPITVQVGLGGPEYYGNCDSGGILFDDGRINPDADATLVGYCSSTDNKIDHGIDVYNPANSHKLFHITEDQLNDAMDKAASLGHAIVIAQAEGQQLWALPTHEFKFVNGSAVPFLYYSAPYPGDYCGTSEDSDS